MLNFKLNDQTINEDPTGFHCLEQPNDPEYAEAYTGEWYVTHDWIEITYPEPATPAEFTDEIPDDYYDGYQDGLMDRWDINLVDRATNPDAYITGWNAGWVNRPFEEF